jgi:hypothetical protein
MLLRMLEVNHLFESNMLLFEKEKRPWKACFIILLVHFSCQSRIIFPSLRRAAAANPLNVSNNLTLSLQQKEAILFNPVADRLSNSYHLRNFT